ncbi:MAG: hypothetical protein M3Y71_02940, partial [Actinomycetota bacterium]|nr:hypothetical protein [Actinomycetota bacterium]
VDVVGSDPARDQWLGERLAAALGVPWVVGDDDHAARRSPRPLLVRCGPPPPYDGLRAQVPALTLRPPEPAEPLEDDDWLAAALLDVETLLARGFELVPSLEQQQAARRDRSS